VDSSALALLEPFSYTADLKARFPKAAIPNFERHNMKPVGFWLPQDAPDANV
jgi:hypothetical protein